MSSKQIGSRGKKQAAAAGRANSRVAVTWKSRVRRITAGVHAKLSKVKTGRVGGPVQGRLVDDGGFLVYEGPLFAHETDPVGDARSARSAALEPAK